MEQAALSADGHTLATRVLHALGGDDQVWLWDISPGQEPKRKGALKSDKAQELWPWSLAPDGKTLITTQRMNSDNIEKTLDLWDAGTGKKLREWTFPGYVNNGAFAFAPDSRHLAVANLDSTVYILRLDEPKSSAGR
jgi:WD40 repeat protein